MNNIKIVPMNADHLESLERLERICFSRPWSRKMHRQRAGLCGTAGGR